MAPRTERNVRPWSLTRRLSTSLATGSLLLAVGAGYSAATDRERAAATAASERERLAATALAARAAPLLRRGDLMRLSVLAAVVGDQTRDRVLMLDSSGEVVIDTSLALGGSTLPLLAGEGSLQRLLQIEGEPPVRETVSPVRADGEITGEVRLRRALSSGQAAFDWSWFGLTLFAGLALTALATRLVAGWSRRVRSASDALVCLAAGGSSEMNPHPSDGELRDFGRALRELERGMTEGLQQVRDAYVEMALAVVEGMEQRQLVPQGHGARTAELAARLADRLQLTDAERADLDVACRLVDLGKASLRSSLLEQREPLDERARDSLAHHPVHAAERLERLPALRGVASLLRHQLERYDGCGTPDGLRGDRIPLGARVLAIASSFDALASASPALGWREALEKLERAKGEVFDPWLVDLFCEDVRLQPPEHDGCVVTAAADAAPWREVEVGWDGDEPFGADNHAELEVMLEDSALEGRQP